MKILTIGRGEDCDIVIDDSQDLISRKHAMLRIYPLGKMELVSIGRNGTYVNGLPIKENRPVKVTRKDVISFAHVKQMDWSLVKNPYRIYHISAIVIAALLVIFTIYCMWSARTSTTPSIPYVENGGGPAPVAVQDTTGNKKEEVKTPESGLSKSQADSLFMDYDKRQKRNVQDSIRNSKKEKQNKEKSEKGKTAPKDTTKTKPIKQVF